LSTIREPAEILDFLEASLPKRKVSNAALICSGIIDAGSRYNRYAKHQKLNAPSKRRAQLESVRKHAELLKNALTGQSPINEDDLAVELGAEFTTSLLGYLERIDRTAAAIIDKRHLPKPKAGHPENVENNLWLTEIADIYEQYFQRPAKVLGNSNTARKKRGEFWQFLELCWPTYLPIHGTFGVSTVKRILRQR